MIWVCAVGRSYKLQLSLVRKSEHCIKTSTGTVVVTSVWPLLVSLLHLAAQRIYWDASTTRKLLCWVTHRCCNLSQYVDRPSQREQEPVYFIVNPPTIQLKGMACPVCCSQSAGKAPVWGFCVDGCYFFPQSCSCFWTPGSELLLKPHTGQARPWVQTLQTPIPMTAPL